MEVTLRPLMCLSGLFATVPNKRDEWEDPLVGIPIAQLRMWFELWFRDEEVRHWVRRAWVRSWERLTQKKHRARWMYARGALICIQLTLQDNGWTAPSAE